MDPKSVTAEMCRVCLKNKHKSNRFMKISDNHDGRTIVEHLKELSSNLKVPMTPGMPEMLCKRCLDTLLVCNRFRHQAEKTDLYLSTMSVTQIAFQDVKAETDDNDLLVEKTVSKRTEAPEIKEEDAEQMYDTEDELPLIATVETKLTTDGDKKTEKTARKWRKQSPLKMSDNEEEGQQFFCCKCPALYGKEQDVLDHYVSVHSNQPGNNLRPNVKTTRRFKFECRMCAIACKTAIRLRLHQKQFQNTKQCTECGIFVPHQKFESHLRRHLPEAERRKDAVECHICQKQLYSKKGMTRHLETHATDLKYKCNECGKELKTGSSYYGHVYYHELRRKGKNIKCPACPAKFHRTTALEIHLRTHSGEKPFECNFCDMKYADRSDLRRHMWHHTGESPYKCKMCGKMFTRKDYLRKHELLCRGK